ncbi:response regulator [candidate division KSB1 bacterium]
MDQNLSSAAQPLSVIIVDDDDGLCKLITKKLQPFVTSIEKCSTGTEAVNSILNNPESLVLLDFILPDMNAAEVIDKLQSNNAVPHFIIMTGFGDENIAVEMMKLGALDYLIKDTNFLEFLPTVVNNVINDIRTEQRLKQVEDSLQKSEEAFRFIVEGTSSVIGDKFIFSLIECLASALLVRYAFATEVLDSPPTRVRTLAFWNSGKISDNFEYDLKHTPCAGVLEGNLCIYPDKVQEYFPEDKDLVALNAKSYIGIPLYDSKKELIGHIAVIHDEAITDEEVKKQTLKIFASRAAAELERFMYDNQKKILEEQLFHAQKMESIGRLAGGIAHDFNNILTGIMGYSEFLKMQYPDVSTSEGQAAEVIFNNAERAAHLTKQLLGFARGGKYNPKPVNINELIIETINVSEKIFEKNIKVEYGFDDNIRTIEADKHQIEQVLTNLIINAKDAMPNGGILHFVTENVFINEEYSKIYPEIIPNNYIKLSITDTGIGIAKELIDNIFEPFFTTKGEGEGTGLGLATVYGIVKNHGGYIKVYSELNEGTCFSLFFPVSEKNIEKKEADIPLIKGDAKILVVDDEDFVRDLTVRMLKQLGYSVITAKNGIEAVKIYKDESESIDLVILDMIMPEMSGKETYAALKKIDPDIKVILSSGFSRHDKAAEIINEGGLGFIQKPFRILDLSTAIDKALNNQ